MKEASKVVVLITTDRRNVNGTPIRANAVGNVSDKSDACCNSRFQHFVSDCIFF